MRKRQLDSRQIVARVASWFASFEIGVGVNKSGAAAEARRRSSVTQSVSVWHFVCGSRAASELGDESAEFVEGSMPTKPGNWADFRRRCHDSSSVSTIGRLRRGSSHEPDRPKSQEALLYARRRFPH